MRPVAIFRHSPTEGPGYFALFLEARRIPWTLIPLDAGAPVPENPEDYSGFCCMGGPMSVNDDLPWIAPLLTLLQRALALDIPILGHCLGGQLLSKALGGTVSANPVKEIGWSTIDCQSDAVARHWFGAYAGRTAPVFQWHGETFSIPEGATHIAGNAWCANQIFALGPHLGMQCHIEMLPEMIAHWCQQWDAEAAPIADLPSIQARPVILAEIPRQLPPMRQFADQLYGVWLQGIRHQETEGRKTIPDRRVSCPPSPVS
jgi:GMP synthase-like glutamine amidotransferase